jgi:hypothetical protein
MSRRIGKDGRENRRTPEFREMFERLPEPIRKLANATFEQFLSDPAHPSLRHHPLKNNSSGNHCENSCSVAVTMRYRAI